MKTPYKEGKDAYWDFECGNDDVQRQNPYFLYSAPWREWERGYTDAGLEDDL